jgi:hypothetical protein
MREWQSQAHVKHYCRYHIVFVPKCRKQSIYGVLRKEIGGVFRELCRQDCLWRQVRITLLERIPFDWNSVSSGFRVFQQNILKDDIQGHDMDREISTHIRTVLILSISFLRKLSMHYKGCCNIFIATMQGNRDNLSAA